MTKVIRQSVTFRARPEELFRLYADSRRHSAATGGRASVGRRPGARFTAFGGMLRGRMLAVVPRRMIVQTWRSAGWKKSDLDSILILVFSKARRGGRVELVHVNVPAHDQAGVRRGWRTYYWRPWRAYLTRARLAARRKKAYVSASSSPRRLTWRRSSSAET
jgi:activator of HSP90 ATPase